MYIGLNCLVIGFATRYTLMLFLFEYRGARMLIAEQFPDTAASIVSFRIDSDIVSLDGKEPLQTEAQVGDDGKLHVTVRKSTSSRSEIFSRQSHGVTPRASNLTNAEIYSAQTSRNPTPRGSNFGLDEESGYGVRGMGYPAPVASGLFSPVAGPKKGEAGKDLHMFVWSSSASPVSDGGGLHVYGGGNHEANIVGAHPKGT